MKTLHTVTEPTQYPKFWDEEWLRRAIEELDTRQMSPEERAYFARVTAANAEAVKAEKVKIKEAQEMAEEQTKIGIIKKLLARGLNCETIADIAEVTVEFVKSVEGKMTTL